MAELSKAEEKKMHTVTMSVSMKNGISLRELLQITEEENKKDRKEFGNILTAMNEAINKKQGK